ncbi:hypothetical protein CDAR_509511 [Caerostris darwini]|uniref:Uncharacterized protein n=1 Tax=Caerostris darwini TaxID=1538125 RepID=A0AAV4Q2T2_9ARAC|nr:hypothetical protein CDAR_509511 [Caerostris darwini]
MTLLNPTDTNNYPLDEKVLHSNQRLGSLRARDPKRLMNSAHESNRWVARNRVFLSRKVTLTSSTVRFVAAPSVWRNSFQICHGSLTIGFSLPSCAEITGCSNLRPLINLVWGGEKIYSFT